MNEKDKEALGVLLVSSYLPPATKGSTGDALVARARALLEARLTHLHDLEEALAWSVTDPRVSYTEESEERGWSYDDAIMSIIEPHDGTPQGRAEALVRLHKRVVK